MLSNRMDRLIGQKKKMLVGYLLAGYPGTETFFDVLAASSPGLDILEIGYPSLDPFADGPVIGQAHAKVDREAVAKTEYWKRIRESTASPVWIMAYRKDFVDSGVCLSLAKERLMDAVVLPDTDEAELDRLAKELAEYQVEVVRLINPGMSKSEMDRRLHSSRLIYEQLYVGQTGLAGHSDSYDEMLAYSQTCPGVTRFAGFGISTKEKVTEVLSKGFDGAIIGTEIIRRLNGSVAEFRSYIQKIHEGF